MEKQSEYYVNVENSILEDENVQSRVREYHGEFKKYRPVFKAKPANYYPNTCCDRIIQILMLFPAWIMCGVLLYAFTKWGLVDTRRFGWICLGVWCVYLFIIGKSL